ncbi:MAG: GtrA family protein [Treponema sp.]
MENKINLRECLRFLVSGVFIVCVDFLVYRLLFIKTSIVIAKAVAYITGTITGFFLNKFWTFKSEKKIWKEAFLYFALYAITAFINTNANKFVFEKTNNLIFAYLVATAISTCLNFLGQKFFIFTRSDGGFENEK